MEESSNRREVRLSPLSKARANPRLPPIANPPKARLELSARCLGNSPDLVSRMAAWATSMGAGKVRRETHSCSTDTCQVSRSKSGRAQGAKCLPSGEALMLRYGF